MINVDISISLSVPEPPPPPDASEPYRVLTVPNSGRYMLLLDDWDTDRWGRMPRSRYLNYKKDPPWNALPATIPMGKLFFTLDEQWQRFYYFLCRRSNGYSLSLDVMFQGYKSTTRDAGGWRDRHTWNNVIDERDNIPHDEQKIYTDHVLGLNLLPNHTYGDAAQQDLLSSGNIVKVIGDGGDDWIIETLNTRLTPPPIDEVWGKWWLVGFLTLSAFNWDTLEKRRLKWPFFNGYGCPHMTIGRDGTNRVPKYWCKPIDNGAEFALYT